MRKLLRKLRIEGIDPSSEDGQKQLEEARAIRTKKDRTKPGGRR
jgi:hypothetical protein